VAVVERTRITVVNGDHVSPTLVRVVLTGTGRNANDTNETHALTNTRIETTFLAFKAGERFPRLSLELSLRGSCYL
jgi:NADPH-dependent ferric siderophore reductase